MLSATRKKPAYTLHKPTGQARVRVDGKDHYLGQHGSTESLERYDDLIAEWRSKSHVDTYTLTIDDLTILYVQHADTYYRKPDGRPTGEANNIRFALNPLLDSFGETRARDFSPGRLKQYREALIKAGICRTSINRQVSRVRGMFAWAVENELLPVQTWQALTTVKGLRRGRTDAVESTPVRPVPQADIDGIEKHVSRQIWAMIRLQLLTGARPGEIIAMRGCDLTMPTESAVWEYIPASHKTEHHGHTRTIFLGPQAQAIVKEFLQTDTQACLFSPKDARAEWLATFTGPGRRDKKGTRTRQAGERYTTATFAGAIRRACKKAGVDHWHPHQLRHSRATFLRKHYGIDVARAILGHGTIVTTEIYAELDREKAREVVALIG